MKTVRLQLAEIDAHGGSFYWTNPVVSIAECPDTAGRGARAGP
ncbi:MAG: hypothetical protein ACYTHM_03170 [Planctomycetota bacterium]